MTAVLVVLGAMVGAPLRYLVDRRVQSRYDSPFPWGTFSVNLGGSLVFGGLTGAAAAIPGPVVALVGIGFCGALTTYSTFSFETLRLLEERSHCYAAMNVLISVLAGVGAAVLGHEALRAFVA
ncbi:fluoride efflux transporter CrcB [Saccharopolyspora sp. HNM0983]|uniref:Fluoride-specific ion channel FluC n=1 Tax=Saccharopolyspora montiporae TaxID=2781240 RepID=A0A929B965_9PSEU|nr:fluoride efflux transporter CrcB [Saccharopolyspora sp. HNM0983]